MCFARPVRDFRLDTDTNECRIIAVGKINKISLRTKAEAYGQFTVDELTISTSVIIPIKGQIGQGQKLTFLHRRASALSVPPNGFSSFEFQPEDNYLLFLKEGRNGILELPAPEGHDIVKFSDDIIDSLKNMPVKDSVFERVIDILLANFLYTKELPSDSMKSLSLLMDSKAFRLYIKQEDLKKKCIERLTEIKESTDKWSTLGGAYYYLSRLSEPAEVGEIGNYILDTRHSKSDRFNAMEWLKHYPEDVQIETLREIVDKCSDESVLKAARKRLEEKLELLWNLPRHIEKEFQCLLDPNCDFNQEGFIKFAGKFAPIKKMMYRAAVVRTDTERAESNKVRKVIFRLKDALKSEHLAVRIRAVLVLHSFGDKSGIDVMIEDMTAEDSNDRQAVVEALRKTRDRNAVPALIKALDDPSPQVRGIAIRAISEIGAPQAYDAMLSHILDAEPFRDKDGKSVPVGGLVCEALAKSNRWSSFGDGNKPIGPLIDALSDEAIREAAYKALVKLTGTDFGNSIEEWRTWLEIENIDGKPIVVRVYRNWQEQPEVFEKVTVKIKQRKPNLDSISSDESTVVALLAEDQSDETIKKGIGNRIYAALYKDMNFRLPSYGPQGTEESLWFFDDALGNVILDATVEIFLYNYKGPKIRIRQVVADGSLNKLVPQASLRQFEFIVSHPDYGIAKVTESYRNKSHIFAPLVSAGSKAADRAIRGFVLDPENNPVEYAEILCTNVRTLGEGLISPRSSADRYVALTDERGFFSLYMPSSAQNEEHRGTLIPPKSKYHIQVQAPKQYGLLPFRGPVENGQEATIVMEMAEIADTFESLENVTDGKFRTLVFIGEDGLITKADELRLIGITIYRPNKPKIKLKYDNWEKGALLPNGTYEATMWDTPSASSIKFETLEVTNNSPDELIFEMPLITYSGQIVDGLTDEPMVGAFVMAIWATSKGNLSMITPEQWEKLHDLGNSPSPDDPILGPLKKIYSFKKIVRTDEDGRFDIICPIGKSPYGFVCFEENYIGIMHRKYNLKIDEDRRAQVPVKKLFPAAKVYAEPYVKQGRASVMPRWIINKDNNPQWVDTLLALDDRRESLFTYDKWLKQNSRQSFYVPAGVNLQVQLCTPYESQWCSYTFPETINLVHGEILDLGKCTFEAALKIFVKVVNSSGEPVEGVPVRKSGSVAHNTDENGFIEFNVPPYSKGDFVVTYRGSDDERLRLSESIPYEIAGPEDQGSQYLLHLSDDMLYHLFK
jgi:hypothetical protein